MYDVCDNAMTSRRIKNKTSLDDSKNILRRILVLERTYMIFMMPPALLVGSRRAICFINGISNIIRFLVASKCSGRDAANWMLRLSSRNAVAIRVAAAPRSPAWASDGPPPPGPKKSPKKISKKNSSRHPF